MALSVEAGGLHGSVRQASTTEILLAPFTAKFNPSFLVRNKNAMFLR